MEIIFSILSHPMRREILIVLEKEGMLSYSDLLRKLVINTGKLNYHLREMRDLIIKNQKGYLISERGKLALELMRISQKIMSGEEIPWIGLRETEITRIGIVICSCNNEIADIIDVGIVKKHISNVSHVVSVIDFDNACQKRNIKIIKKWVHDNLITKVVLGACSPRTHESIFKDLMIQADIDIFEIANIREQCAWVHAADKDKATDKAKVLIEAAVSKVKERQSIPAKRIRFEKTVAVIGGGIAGILLSQYLSRLNFQVNLIERSPTLGGKASRWSRISRFQDCANCILNEEILKLTESPNVTIFTNSEVTQLTGDIGNFEISVLRHPRYILEDKCIGCHRCIDSCPKTRKNEYEMGLIERKVIFFPFPYSYPYIPVINSEDIESCKNCRICIETCNSKAIDLEQREHILTISAGAIIIATGCDLHRELEEWKYNPYNDIVTSLEFERILAGDGPTSGRLLRMSDSTKPESIAIIQCVNHDRGCSHYCCELALKYIDEVQEKSPSTKIEIFYDIDKIPSLPKLGNIRSLFPNQNVMLASALMIEVRNGKRIVSSADIEKEFDMVVLNIGMIPSRDLQQLRRMVGFAIDQYGFLREETLMSGCYACGSVTGPKDYHETIADAKDKAIQIATKFSEEYIFTDKQCITLNHQKCGICLLCVLACPYMALYLEEDKIKIDEFKCRGCGICIPICPSKAIDIVSDSTRETINKIEVLAKASNDPKVIVFCCMSCGYAAADHAGAKRMSYSPNVFIVKVPCAGRVDSDYVLRSFELGFDGVLIFGCSEEVCRYLSGVKTAKRKIEAITSALEDKKDRILFVPVSGVDGIKFATTINDFVEMIANEN